MPSPERLYICHLDDCRDPDHVKHLARYRLASMFIEGGQVLDCACGSGYGTRMLAGRARNVLGIDAAPEAVAYARERNHAPNAEFSERLLQNVNFPADSWDAVVSLETLEHVPKAEAEDYMARAAGWIRPGGVFVGSSPMLRYRDGKPYVTNPFHCNELPRQELLAIVNKHFQGFNIILLHQGTSGFKPLGAEDTGFLIWCARRAG